MQNSTSNSQLLGLSVGLEKRLASYGAMAIAAAIGGTANANAAIIAFDPADATTPNGTPVSFNILTGAVDGETANDFFFRFSSFSSRANASAGGIGSGRSIMAGGCGNECISILKLGLGNLIGPAGNFRSAAFLGSRFSFSTSTTFTEFRAADLVGGGNGLWQADGTPTGRGFMGLRFVVAGNTHFGWADITLNPDFSVTLHSFAYEACADQGIDAGATSGGADCSTVGEVPEPHSAAMLAMGAAGLLAYRRRRKAA